LLILEPETATETGGSREAAMSDRKRHAITVAFVVLISLTLLAAPARGDDWFGIHLGSGGFGISFGSADWAVYGSSWSNPVWAIDFHVALAGYGEWVWIDGLGQCWRPWVRTGWRPFTHGRWVWTAYGWTWVAYEPWGYFPHHYGHWAMTNSGWVWAPGTVYVPANVVWVHHGPHVGWYASPPPGWSHSHHGFHQGYAQGRYDGFSHGYRRGVADGYWAGWNDARYATFVDWNHIGSDDLGRHAVSAATMRSSAATAVPRAGVSAPDRSELARRGVAVPAMTLERRTVRVAGQEMMVARPREAAASVARNARSTAGRALAPAAIENLQRRSAAGQTRSEGSTVRSGTTMDRSPDRSGSPRSRPEPAVERRGEESPRSFAPRVVASFPSSRASEPTARVSERFRGQGAAPRTSGTGVDRGAASAAPTAARRSDSAGPSGRGADSRHATEERSRSSAESTAARSRSNDDGGRESARRGRDSELESEVRTDGRSRRIESDSDRQRSRSRSTSRRR
jgi:hypothetical protein